eukprot:COSAG04_NODE_51_length_31064_cov_38.384789_2_plen_59_part_00
MRSTTYDPLPSCAVRRMKALLYSAHGQSISDLTESSTSSRSTPAMSHTVHSQHAAFAG